MSYVGSLVSPIGVSPIKNLNLDRSTGPKPVITNEREHANVLRLARIEHNLDEARSQEINDRSALKNDLSKVHDQIQHVAKIENQTHVTLDNFASMLNKLDQERYEEGTALLSAIASNSNEIKGLITNVNQLDLAERAELILTKVSSSARAVSKVAEIAGDSVGAAIPIFGAQVSSGAKVIAETAEFVADTTQAVQSSGILKHLDEIFKAITVSSDTPKDIITPALKVSTTTTELIQKIKDIMERNSRSFNLTFEKVHSMGSPLHSYVERHYSLNQYNPIARYIIRPSVGSVDFIIEFSGKEVSIKSYKQHEFKEDGSAKTIIQLGSVPAITGEIIRIDFNCHPNSHQVMAFGQAIRGISSVSTIDKMFYLEQFLSIGLKPDNKQLLNRYHSELHDTILSNTYGLDWHQVEAQHGESLKTQKQRLKRSIGASHGESAADLHVPDEFSDLQKNMLNVKMSSKTVISGYNVYTYLLGPFIRYGEYRVGVIMDDTNFSGLEQDWYIQLTRCAGNEVFKANTSGDYVYVTKLTINALGLDQKLSDLIKIKVYAKKAISVRLIGGWVKGTEVKHVDKKMQAYDRAQKNKNDANHEITKCISYATLDRYIDPALITTSADLGYHTWNEYGNNNWTNIS